MRRPFRYRRIEYAFRKIALRYIWSFITTICAITSVISIVVTQANTGSVANAQRIAELQQKFDMVVTYQNLAEKRLTELAEHAKRKGDDENAEMLRKITKELEALRIQAEIGKGETK